MTKQNNYDYIDLYNIHDRSYTKAGKALDMSPQTFRNKYNKQVAEMPYVEEYQDVAYKQEQTIQKMKDKNRVANKNWRNDTRTINALVEVDNELKDVIKENKITFRKAKKIEKGDSYGILQLSDLHLNEQVDFQFGRYDWDIASKRLHKHVEKAMVAFKANKVSNVVVVMTGDMINSDRRLDEVLTNATNRANTLFLASKLILQAIEHLNHEGYKVSVTYVAGNESRINLDIGISDILASDNFDTMIYHLLRELSPPCITYVTPEKVVENVIGVGGCNILLLHGHLGMKKSKKTTSAHQYMAKYSEIDVKIDYVMFGHIHQASITETYGRSGSLVGNNEYNINALNIYGKASQNYYIVKGKEVNGTVNVLDDTVGYEGYGIEDDLKSYNTKSADKYKPSTIVVKVIC